MQMVYHFYCSELRRHQMGGRQQEVKMSEKNGGRKQETGIFERTQSLHSVCVLCVAHLWTEKDSIVRASRKGFLSAALKGQRVAWPCCGAPQEGTYQGHSSDLGFLSTRMTNSVSCQLAQISNVVNESSPPFSYPVCSFSFLSSSYCRIYFFFPFVFIFLSLHTLSLSNHEPGELSLPHRSGLWCILCLWYLGKRDVTLLSWDLRVNHMSYVQPMMREPGNFLSAIRSPEVVLEDRGGVQYVLQFPNSLLFPKWFHLKISSPGLCVLRRSSWFIDRNLLCLLYQHKRDNVCVFERVNIFCLLVKVCVWLNRAVGVDALPVRL